MDKPSSPAPIAIFIYNRLDLTRRTLETLAANRLASRSELLAFSDGPKTEAEVAKVEAVRDFVSSFNGFARTRLIPAAHNHGLGHSIISGVTRTMGEYGRAIIMEDDLITSPHFLNYMNDALLQYAAVEKVAAISGYLPPVDTELPETFFLQDAECWGWATWQRAWSLFEANGARLLAEIRRRRLAYVFDQEGTYPFISMLENQIAGINSSWAVRWRASIILHDRLSLYPGRSLVDNIGFDGSGTHCGTSNDWRADTGGSPIRLSDTTLQPSRQALNAIKRFNRRTIDYSLMDRIISKIKRIIRTKTRTSSSVLAA